MVLVGFHPSWIGVANAGDEPPVPSGSTSDSSSENPAAVGAVESMESELADGTSISCGSANRGALRGAVEMPIRGLGFEVPEPWWSRGYRHGTHDLVDLVIRAAAAVDAEHPGSVLGVADLSKSTGGALPGHRSHQSGRDVDLHFYTLDPGGKPYLPDKHMPYFSRTGKATYAKAPSWSRSIPERYFDLARNWSLVKVLITDEDVTVQNIFVSRRIRRWLLDYARALEEPDELVGRAAVVLRKAAGRTHNDHMHVRIGCSDHDSRLGRCRDRLAPPRQGKRKYHSRVRCPARKRAPATEKTSAKKISRAKTSRAKKKKKKTKTPPSSDASGEVSSDAVAYPPGPGSATEPLAPGDPVTPASPDVSRPVERLPDDRLPDEILAD